MAKHRLCTVSRSARSAPRASGQRRHRPFQRPAYTWDGGLSVRRYTIDCRRRAENWLVKARFLPAAIGSLRIYVLEVGVALEPDVETSQLVHDEPQPDSLNAAVTVGDLTRGALSITY